MWEELSMRIFHREGAGFSTLFRMIGNSGIKKNCFFSTESKD